MRKSILIILPAEDFNEQEFFTVTNLFEKAKFKIFIASDAFALCKGTNGMKVRADVSFYNIHESNFEGIVFVGGKGVKKYWDNSTLHSISRKFNQLQKPIAAICSAPVILARAGLLNNVDSTCYTADKEELEREGANYLEQPVVFHRNIITAGEPSASGEFTAAIIDNIS